LTDMKSICCGAPTHCAWKHLYCFQRDPKPADVDAMRAFDEVMREDRDILAALHDASPQDRINGATHGSEPFTPAQMAAGAALPALKGNPKDAVGATKPQLHLVPPSALIHMAKVFELGAKKYGPYNWRGNAVNMTVYISAAMRHLVSMLDGQTIDPESGEPHAAHVADCMAILMDAGDTGNLIDDRPKPGPAADLIAQLTVKKAS
jgi:hypothetical protein